MGYLTALARTDLDGHLDYVMRNLIEKWFQTLKMRVTRFHTIWNGSAASAGSLPSPSTTTFSVPVRPSTAAHQLKN